MEAEAKTIPLKPDDNLTREQRRARERTSKEITDMINSLVRQWYNFFIENDPESDEVMLKAEEVSAKWKMYCHRKKLKPEALDLVSKTIVGLMEEYQKAGGPRRKSPIIKPSTSKTRWYQFVWYGKRTCNHPVVNFIVFRILNLKRGHWIFK